MNLSEYYLLKSFKYIRREWRNGRWRYWYEEPKNNTPKTGGFGTIYTGYEGKPHEAIRKLLREKSGQCANVFSCPLPVLVKNEDTGKWEKAKDEDGNDIMADTDVDLVYGNSFVGLRHIIEKHYIYNNDYSSLSNLEDAVVGSFEDINNERPDAELDNEKENLPKFEILDSNNNKLVIQVQIKKDDNGEIQFRHFILTSFDKSRNSSRKKNSAKERKARKNSIPT